MQRMAHGTNFAMTAKTPGSDESLVVRKGLVEGIMTFSNTPHSHFRDPIKVKDASFQWYAYGSLLSHGLHCVQCPENLIEKADIFLNHGI